MNGSSNGSGAARVAAFVQDLEQRRTRGEDVSARKAHMIAIITAELQRRWVVEGLAARARRNARARGLR
jgi:hypothetical protein